MIRLIVNALLCILPIKACGKEKDPEHCFLADRNPEVPSKDVIIISKHDTESNEERTAFNHEQAAVDIFRFDADGTAVASPAKYVYNRSERTRTRQKRYGRGRL